MTPTRRDFHKVAVTSLATLSLPKATRAVAFSFSDVFSTGFSELDDVLGGGFKKGRYYLLLESPTSSKSCLLESWHENHSKRSAFYESPHQFILGKSKPFKHLILIDARSISMRRQIQYSWHLSVYAADKKVAVVQTLPVNYSIRSLGSNLGSVRFSAFNSALYSPDVAMRLDNSENGKLCVEVLKNLHGPLKRIIVQSNAR